MLAREGRARRRHRPRFGLAADLHGAGLKILGADTTGMDILFFTKAGSPIKSIYALSGKKVGFSSPGSSSNVALQLSTPT